MSDANEPAVSERLHQAGLLKQAEPDTAHTDTPWYVKLLLAFSGWLAAIFLLGFIGAGLAFIIDIPAVAIVVGSAMIGGAYVLLRAPKNEFIEHLSLALSLAGQGLMIWGLFSISERNFILNWLIIGVIQSALAWAMPNNVHRVFSIVVAVYAFAFMLFEVRAYYLINSVLLLLVTWLWLHEFDYPQNMRKIRAIGYGLVLALIPLQGAATFGHGIFYWRAGNAHTSSWFQPWLGELLTGAVLLYFVWQLLNRADSALSKLQTYAVLASTLIFTLVSIEAAGITIGITIILLGFYGSNRILMGLGCAALLFYISSYYYLLSTTLLDKSQLLLATGLVLFFMRWLMRQFIVTEKGVSHGK